MMDVAIIKEISHLTLCSIEGIITNEQFERLESLLRTNSQARRCYLMIINDHLYLNDYDMISSQNSQMVNSSLNLNELANYERIAPTVKIPEVASPRELIQDFTYAVHPRQINRQSLYSAIFSVAAMLFIVLFLKLAPVKDHQTEVAMLVDQVDAKWANENDIFKTGMPFLKASQPYLLREGYAEIVFDNSAEVTVSAPAEFWLVDGDQIWLNYGQVYCKVPPEAYGFQVTTQCCKIIDLGTEFGVKQEPDGDMEVHVLDGKTICVPKSGDAREKNILEENFAKRFDSSTGKLLDIPCQSEYFVREIDSENNLVWQGQKTFNLAYVVGGGSGLNEDHVILKEDVRSIYAPVNKAPAPSSYERLCSPLVDGVFSPNPNQNTQTISSAGHVFVGCPVTKVSDDGRIMCRIIGKKNGTFFLNFKAEPSMQKVPAIWMHSNAGVTFSLDDIRQAIPNGAEVARFSTQVSMLSDTVKRAESMRLSPPKAMTDVFVLVDGVVRFKRLQLNAEMGSVPVQIPILPDDKFLTLIVTDSGQILYDWAVFAEPYLELKL